MAKVIYAANALTGGVSGCLDDILHTALEDGNTALVTEASTNTFYVFTYDASETGVESSPDIIIPDSNVTGTGAWVKTHIDLDEDNIHTALTDAHSATNAATASRIALRDASGNIKIGTAAADTDALNRVTADGRYGQGNVILTSGYPVSSVTDILLHSVVTVATWESVGPTGSGADNIWTALDGVPTGVSWIRVRCNIVASASGAVAGVNYSSALNVRRNGSAIAVGVETRIALVGANANAAGSGQAGNVVEATIPVSTRMFDAHWVVAANTSTYISLWLIGYGYNQ